MKVAVYARPRKLLGHLEIHSEPQGRAYAMHHVPQPSWGLGPELDDRNEAVTVKTLIFTVEGRRPSIPDGCTPLTPPAAFIPIFYVGDDDVEDLYEMREFSPFRG